MEKVRHRFHRGVRPYPASPAPLPTTFSPSRFTRGLRREFQARLAAAHAPNTQTGPSKSSRGSPHPLLGPVPVRSTALCKTLFLRRGPSFDSPSLMKSKGHSQTCFVSSWIRHRTNVGCVSGKALLFSNTPLPWVCDCTTRCNLIDAQERRIMLLFSWKSMCINTRPWSSGAMPRTHNDGIQSSRTNPGTYAEEAFHIPASGGGTTSGRTGSCCYCIPAIYLVLASLPSTKHYFQRLPQGIMLDWITRQRTSNLVIPEAGCHGRTHSPQEFPFPAICEIPRTSWHLQSVTTANGHVFD